jgi:midasin
MCVLDSNEGSISVLDRPGSERLQRHPDFRLLGAMNPATDAGKRHLPSQIKARFTEVYISEPQDREDLVSAPGPVSLHVDI